MTSDEIGDVGPGAQTNDAENGITVHPDPKCPLYADSDPGSQNPFGIFSAPPNNGL